MTITQWYCTCVHCFIPCSLLQTMDAPVEPPPCYGAFSTECGGCHYTWRGLGPGWKATTIGVFNPSSHSWSIHQTTGDIPPGQCSGVCVSIEHSVYCFGGLSDGPTYHNELHKLNLETFQWVKLNPKNNPSASPICKASCGIVALNKKTLCCFGGEGILGSTQPSPGSTFIRDTLDTDGSGWTNEFHLFDLERGTIINHCSTLCLDMYIQCVSLSSHKAVHTCILSSTHITYSCTQSCDYTMLSHSQTHFQESGRYLY